MNESKPQTQIRSTGQVREFLMDMMVGVKNGHVDLDSASRITKLAAQITENLYAEVKVGKLHIDAGGSMALIGDLHLGTLKTKT